MFFNLNLQAGDRVILHVGATREFYLLQWACFRYGFVAVPLHASASSQHLEHIINICIPKVVFSDSSFEYLRNAEFAFLQPGDVYKMAEMFPTKQFVPCWIPAPDDLSMLLPTSGTTGIPKLVEFTDAMMSRPGKHCSRHGSDMILLSYTPLRQAVDSLVRGAKIAVWRGNMDLLWADCQFIRPTVLGGMPTLFSALKQAHETQGDKNLLGNRVRQIVIGGAQSTKEQKNWLFKTFGCAVLDGYGSTETGGLTLNGESDAVSLLLIDCPQLGFLTSDEPRPRGEIVSLITDRTTPGYYKDRLATKSAKCIISNRSYWRTGDIGERSDTGNIIVIDRISSCFKLSNGHFVSPSLLEGIFGASELVKFVFLFADRSNEALVAAVVPRNECTELQLLEDFYNLGKQLQSYEIPKRVLVDLGDWTVRETFGEFFPPSLRD